MGCNSTSGIAFGVLGECATLEIGCIITTEGQPTEAPLSDELPIHFDRETGSLWIWRCNASDESGTWEELKHETLCDAALLDPTEIADICTKLHIPVTYSETGDCCAEDCEERRITILQFAQQIKTCLDLRRVCELGFIENAVVNSAGLVQLAACVDGVEGLITPYSLCNLSTMNQGQVDAATSVMLGACVDGDNRLIPIPPEPEPYSMCELTPINQLAVDSATSVMLGACVDGTDNLIPVPLPFSVCGLSTLVQDPVDPMTSMTVAVCVNDVDVKVTKSTYFSPPICSFTAINQTAVDDATLVQIAACVDGASRLIPYIEQLDICDVVEYGNSFIFGGGFGTPTNVLCLDDAGEKTLVRTPWIPPNHLLPSADQIEADAATLVEVPVILDGVDKRVTLTVLKALLAALP